MSIIKIDEKRAWQYGSEFDQGILVILHDEVIAIVIGQNNSKSNFQRRNFVFSIPLEI